ncbi:MAG: bifunctional histidinol-phosphatase/imidazoleglycerol-phosphate dehydratase HisB [Bacteroidetes bacterium]|uniref:Histidine biosynthesis bifunctional protein HisB n=1 Tax=Candidatus Enterocola intestinipullorum TaxID=2840783 RepID=A0A9D9EHK5_9BACT|nr:bifunctional histidinol-phosphatase/imidazoleglycerol-phosphate dehydratase HisB [Candidatus Enterocola intestinipullorum]
MKKRALFIDRDGTIIVEPPVTEQVNTLEELEFLPGAIRNLYFIARNLDFELVMVTNQDGLGTPAYPMENFEKVQGKMLQILEGEGVVFNDIKIDKSRPEDGLPTRKPGTGMLTAYMDGSYDLSSCYVIGDRETDEQLAENLGAKAIRIGSDRFPDWDKICEYLFAGERSCSVSRKTKETDIKIALDLDGTGKTSVSTGIGFFDHMLEQIGKHAGIDLTIDVHGDLNVDEHHTIEDTGIALGEALSKALGDKRGIERYGYCLPMDDCLCSVALDFGGRPWLVWDVELKREKVGDFPTEMLMHFFKSLSDNAKMNLNVKAEGENEHHKIEGIFKAFARSIKMAIKRDIYKFELPSTKGSL